jgi:hypothetical protein
MKVGDREVAYVNGVLNPTGFAPRPGTHTPPIPCQGLSLFYL